MKIWEFTGRGEYSPTLHRDEGLLVFLGRETTFDDGLTDISQTDRQVIETFHRERHNTRFIFGYVVATSRDEAARLLAQYAAKMYPKRRQSR